MSKTMTEILREEIPLGEYKPGQYMMYYYMHRGFMQGEAEGQPATIRKAYALRSLFEDIEKHIHKGDIIVGGIWGLIKDGVDHISQEVFDAAFLKFRETGFRHFGTSADHSAPNYKKLVENASGS